DGSFRLRLMLDTIPLPWDWPVEVNYLEAKAFCNWMAQKTGKPVRLPTEAEWHRLRDHALQDIDQPYWSAAPGNINLEYFASSCPVNKFAQGDFYDVIGNVWQWSETPISGLPGFEVHPFYDDFSTPTFDNRHNLIKGGSWISTGNEATRDARYAFRRHFFQQAGFRYIVSSSPVKIPAESYELDPDVSLRCEFNYGREYLGVPNFSRKAAELCFRFNKGRKFARALNLGCDTGRTAFELAAKFEQVTGLEFTARYLRIAQQLKDSGWIRYQLPEEGELVSFHEHSLSEFGLEGNAARVDFWQADASNLKTIFKGYDLVYIQNILDRVYDPTNLLDRITRIVLPGGLLVISSVHDWHTEFTIREKWLGGVRKDGEPLTTLEGLRGRLSQDFKLIADPVDIPLVKRLTARKFQFDIAEFTIWEKTGNREDQ
ncbi:MAG: putative 4-mercaptohistidine N1-methyltransferase, partial [Candidatus Cloacimonetes bacterium]|nr:putative 4-mercaptohistidine N1-methyltransferase [Candidatus Cloacimonadota bacterium]